jgi:hypothetical protein
VTFEIAMVDFVVLYSYRRTLYCYLMRSLQIRSRGKWDSPSVSLCPWRFGLDIDSRAGGLTVDCTAESLMILFDMRQVRVQRKVWMDYPRLRGTSRRFLQVGK